MFLAKSLNMQVTARLLSQSLLLFRKAARRRAFPKKKFKYVDKKKMHPSKYSVQKRF